MTLLSRLYSLTLFWRTGGHFARMVAALPQVLESCVIVKPVAEFGLPPPEAKQYAMEVCSYMVAHYKRFARMADDPDAQRRRARERDSYAEGSPGFDFSTADENSIASIADAGLRAFVTACCLLMAACNGPWWTSNRILHWCGGPTCCPRGRPDTLLRMRWALRDTIYRQIPATPAINKWTKLGPTCDILVFGLLVNRILAQTFLSLGFRHSMPLDDSLDPQMVQGAMFSAVVGRRYAASKEFLLSPDVIATLVSLALALEPLRALSSWWMRRARQVEGFTCRRPPMDILHRPMSILTIALQYISSFLAGGSKRLLLVWRHTCSDTYAEWFQKFPRQVQQLRRMMLLVSASIYKRHVCTLRAFPWLLASLADERLSDADREKIAAAFDSKGPCCCPPGFAKS